jgi:UDP-glucose 4-epimerase
MILITGGTGFIGSHIAVACLAIGKQVLLLDNLGNSNIGVIDTLQKITHQPVTFIRGDVLDQELLIKTMQDFGVDEVIHCAGLKSVPESVDNPLRYYLNNVQGSLCLLQAMQTCEVKTIVFSSSATVYGEPSYLPYDEAHPTNPMNPYGRTKLQVEQMLRDLAQSDTSMKIMCLRYFNPVGAHESGFIGENPQGIPNNLMPYITRVAKGELPYLNIYGIDYPTRDGTGERDYIHVMDLAEGHVMALDYLKSHPGYGVVNLGTGTPYSVFDLVNTFQEISGKTIPFEIAPRRNGDLPSYFANPTLAKQIMGYETKRDLKSMCASAWSFQNQLGIQ